MVQNAALDNINNINNINNSLEPHRKYFKVFSTLYFSLILKRHPLVIPEYVIQQISCVSFRACRDNIVMRSRDSAFATQAVETRNGAEKDKVINLNFV